MWDPRNFAALCGKPAPLANAGSVNSTVQINTELYSRVAQNVHTKNVTTLWHTGSLKVWCF